MEGQIRTVNGGGRKREETRYTKRNFVVSRKIEESSKGEYLHKNVSRGEGER